jgi:glycine betaine/proline transport system substrate-binding protein
MRLLGFLILLGLLTLPALAQDDIVSLPNDPVQLPTIDAPPSAAPDAAADADASSSAEPAPPAPCGGETITIAKMQWPSAQLMAEIHARLIKENFGCDVEVVPGDMASTASSMGVNGQPAVAPELWITRVADVWNGALKTQEVRQAGTTYADQLFEGWFVPDYEAAAHPDVLKVANLKDRFKDFIAPGGKKARFISCPPDWACAVINRNLIKAFGLSDLFDVVEPANRFELDTLISEAESRKEPILFYYWQPNAVLAQFGFKPVDLGPFNKDNFTCLGRDVCTNPQPSSFASDPVVVALAQWVYLEAPEVAAYFQRAHMPFSEMNALLQNLNEPGATIESVADAFVAARGEIWQQWVGKPVGN